MIRGKIVEPSVSDSESLKLKCSRREKNRKGCLVDLNGAVPGQARSPKLPKGECESPLPDLARDCKSTSASSIRLRCGPKPSADHCCISQNSQCIKGTLRPLLVAPSPEAEAKQAAQTRGEGVPLQGRRGLGSIYSHPFAPADGVAAALRDIGCAGGDLVAATRRGDGSWRNG